MLTAISVSDRILSWSSSIKIWILHIEGGQRIDQKRKKGWWRGSRERIEKGAERREKRQEGAELTI